MNSSFRISVSSVTISPHVGVREFSSFNTDLNLIDRYDSTGGGSGEYPRSSMSGAASPSHGGKLGNL